MIAQEVYYVISAVLTAIGIALIYQTNRRMRFRDAKITQNWAQYVVHIIALSLVAVTQVVYSVTPNLQYGYIVFNFVYSFTLVLICWIIWTQACLPELGRRQKMTIYHLADGTVELRVDKSIDRNFLS